MIVVITSIIVFILLGVLLSMGKGAFLIAGYNTASEAEKRTIDEKKLCRLVGRLMFVLAGCMAVLALSIPLKSKVLEWSSLGLFLGAVIFFVIYINTGGRIKKNVRENDLEETVRSAEADYRKNHPDQGGSK